MPQIMASPHGLLSPPSPHAPVPSSAFVASAACLGGRGIAERGGADLLLIGPAMGFEAVRLLLTAGINHPQAVPLWG